MQKEPARRRKGVGGVLVRVYLLDSRERERTMTLYTIRFRAGRKVVTWQMFAYDTAHLIETTQKAAINEYPGAFIQILEIRNEEEQ